MTLFRPLLWSDLNFIFSTYTRNLTLIEGSINWMEHVVLMFDSQVVSCVEILGATIPAKSCRLLLPSGAAIVGVFSLISVETRDKLT